MFSQEIISSTIWKIDNLETIGGNKIEVFGNPKIVQDGNTRAISFDGIDDGIIVHANPLDNANEFTLEILFRPDESVNLGNMEQRFLHIQNPSNEKRRILIELRLKGENDWFLDTFLGSDNLKLTLYAEQFPHPTKKWYHAALVYKNGVAKHYVDGKEEMSGQIDFSPIENGHTSIGMRMNFRSYFKGVIKSVRMTKCVLRPNQFMYEKSF
jgi:hypothetical protein